MGDQLKRSSLTKHTAPEKNGLHKAMRLNTSRLDRIRRGRLVVLVLSITLGSALWFGERPYAPAKPSAEPRDTQGKIPPPPAISTPTEIPDALTTGRVAALVYSESSSFAKNLLQLKEYCRSNDKEPGFQRELSVFLRILFNKALTEMGAIRDALGEPDGTAMYRNILLACLVPADGTTFEKADIVWRIAVNHDEPIELRRTAVQLSTKFIDGRVRSDDVISLLTDSDVDLLILALKVAPDHVDNRIYRFVKSTLLASSNINIRIAAVDAIGRSAIVERQSTLLEIIDSQVTSKETIFSDASLMKRKAIANLEMGDQRSRDLIQEIVQDATEDPTVRAKAISKFTEGNFPGSTDVLLDLLEHAQPDEGVLLTAIQENLLRRPTNRVTEAIRSKAERLSDQQLSKFLISRLEKAINQGTP